MAHRRISERDLSIVEAYAAGTPGRVLAERYDLSAARIPQIRRTVAYRLCRICTPGPAREWGDPIYTARGLRAEADTVRDWINEYRSRYGVLSPAE